MPAPETNMPHYTTVQEVVEYGIDDIDEDAVVEVPVRDLLFAYKAMGEVIRFFQNPAHYPDIEAVNEFMGNTEEGALRVLWEAQAERLIESLPDEVTSSIEAGELDHPEPPEYGRRTAEGAGMAAFDEELDEDEEFEAHGFGEEFGDDDDDDDRGLGGLFDDLDLD
jgi:hypothetical protein